MKVYETWEDFPSCRLDPITVTDAPAGMRLVDMDDYEWLLAENERLKNAIDHLMSGDMDPEDRAVAMQIIVGKDDA